MDLPLLQPLRWRGVECEIHHEQDARDEQHHVLYMWHEQAMIEWLRRMISIVACCHSVKLCAHAARDFRWQHHTHQWLRLQLVESNNCQGGHSLYFRHLSVSASVTTLPGIAALTIVL